MSLKFKWMLDDTLRPQLPTKAGPDEIGYDLKLVSKVKDNYIDGKCVSSLYTTGWAVCPPPGYYSILVARSSLGKTQYTMANCLGIIDPTYRGQLMVILRNCTTTETTLVNPEVQLILLPIPPNVDVELCDELDITTRGEGGFGSTNKK